MINHAKIRRRVAEMSPKSYAKQILKRNKRALADLEALWARRREIDKREEWEEDGDDLGCPHCNRPTLNNPCIWAKAWSEENDEDIFCSEACGWIEFGGYTLRDIRSHSFCWVIYERDAYSVDMEPCDKDERKERYEEYRACKAFLNGHIKWAQAAYWGKDRK